MTLPQKNNRNAVNLSVAPGRKDGYYYDVGYELK
jgi:hypothetical protein